MSKLHIHAGDDQYLFEQSFAPLPEGKSVDDIPNPHIMIDENGNIADHEDVLFNVVDAANANGLNWCGWDYFGPFNFYTVDKSRVREGAAYEEFSNGWIATEMLEVYQSHLTQ